MNIKVLFETYMGGGKGLGGGGGALVLGPSSAKLI